MSEEQKWEKMYWSLYNKTKDGTRFYRERINELESEVFSLKKQLNELIKKENIKNNTIKNNIDFDIFNKI